MKTIKTKSALLMSVLSLVLCLAMLTGTTFAWFTDTVTSARNQIVAGNLDVTLKYWDGTQYSDVTETTKLFNDASLWEPGHTEVAYLEVGNAGSLALLYQLSVNVYEETQGINVDGDGYYLSDYLVFSVVDKKIESDADLYTRDEAITAAGNEMGMETYYSGDKTLLNTGDANYVALIIYMPETVGNEANPRTGFAPTITMGASLVATQYVKESDSFGPTYDEDAYTPVAVVPGMDTEFDFLGTFDFVVPADAIEAGTVSLMPSATTPELEVIAPTDTTTTKKVAISLDLSIDGIKEGNTAPITVKYTIPEDGETYTDVVAVYHNGVALDAADYSFDAATRTITFKTTSFSPFEFVMDTGAIVIPESYTNDEAVAMLKNAAAGAVIDGLGRTIKFSDSVKNGSAGFTLTKSITLRNMTLTAGGTGYTLQVDAKNAEVVFQNMKFTTSTFTAKGAVEFSTNAKKSVIVENCVFAKKAYIQGSNITFKDCEFNANNNVESASNITFTNCNFTAASNAFTFNSGLKNILIEGCTFKSRPIKLYDNMKQPTNVQIINSTYKTSLYYTIGANVDLDAWKAAGAWIEVDNVMA